MSFFNDPWVIGIGGGILSGAIVAWLTHVILDRGENKEYTQKVASANRDVIYAIRPGISEGQIPTKDVIDALVHATARRHGITPSAMYGAHELAEELIKEVMDSSFLSSVRKAEYCRELIPLQIPRPPSNLQLEVTSTENDASSMLSSYQRRTREWVSILLGFLTTMISIMMVAITKFLPIKIPSPDQTAKSQVLLIVITTATVLVSTAFVYFISLTRRWQRIGRIKEEITERQNELRKYKEKKGADDRDSIE